MEPALRPERLAHPLFTAGEAHIGDLRKAGGIINRPPEGGLVPPIGGYRNLLPLPPRGRGRRPKAGRGRGAALPILFPLIRGGDISNLGELRAGVDRITFWRILQKVKICPSPLVLLRRSCEDRRITGGWFLWVGNRGKNNELIQTGLI